MAFSRTCTFIYIGLVALLDRINQASLASLFQQFHWARSISSRLPNGPGRLGSFGAPNDGPVRGMHFGGLVRLGTESENLGPDIDDCSFRIQC